MITGQALLGVLQPFFPCVHRKLCGGVVRCITGSEQGAAEGMGELGEDGAGSSSKAHPLQVSKSKGKLWQGHSSLSTTAGAVEKGAWVRVPAGAHLSN